MPFARHLGFAAGLLALSAQMAIAQPAVPPSAEEALALGTQLRAWLGRMVGPEVDVAALDLRITPEGEAYRMEVPFGGSFLDGSLLLADGAFAATVKPLDDGRWAIVGASFPASMRADMGNSASSAATGMVLRIAAQETTGTFDPSLATASSFTTVLTGYTMEMTGAAGAQASTIARLEGRTNWQPTMPGRVTLTSDTLVQDYTTMSPMPDGTTMKVRIDRMGGKTRLDNVDFDGIGAILRTSFALGAASRAAAPDDATKRLVHALLDGVANLMDAVETEYTYDGIAIDGGPAFAGGLRHAAVGFSLGAPQGRADMMLRLVVEGLESPMIPEGVWRDYLPQRVALNPRIAGVSREALIGFLRRAIDTDGANVEAEAPMLLAAGPLMLGIEQIAIDMGPVRIKGQGLMQVLSVDEASGDAELRATGLDALIRRSNTTPELKMLAPALIFLKGIGRQEGTETVWTITYADQKVMVNDTDLSDLIPAR